MTKIVVIDDEPEMLRVVTRMLQLGGYECTAYSDAKLALANMEEHPADAILTEVFMPHMDAFEVINVAREKFPQVPVIVMSGGGQHLKGDMLASTEALGASAVIGKPFFQKDLLSVVGAAIEKAQQRN